VRVTALKSHERDSKGGTHTVTSPQAFESPRGRKVSSLHTGCSNWSLVDHHCTWYFGNPTAGRIIVPGIENVCHT